MKNYPLVTIGVASYNNARYIVQTLDSIKKQTYSNIELLIVDDNSPDDSEEVIRQWVEKNGGNTSFRRNKENLGIVGVGNKLVEGAGGKYFILFGSDDMMLPDHVSGLVRQFEQLEAENKLAAFMATPVIRINERGEVIDDPQRIELLKTGRLNYYPEGYAKILLDHVSVSAPGVMVRTDLLKKARYNPRYLQEDFPLWLKLSKNHPYGVYEAPNVYYRIHSGSMMASKKAALLKAKINILLDEIDGMKDGHLLRLLTGKIRDRCFDLYKYNKSYSIELLQALNKKKPSSKTLLYLLFMRGGIFRLVKKEAAGTW